MLSSRKLKLLQIEAEKGNTYKTSDKGNVRILNSNPLETKKDEKEDYKCREFHYLDMEADKKLFHVMYALHKKFTTSEALE